MSMSEQQINAILILAEQAEHDYRELWLAELEAIAERRSN